MDGGLILVGAQMGSLLHPHFLNPFIPALAEVVQEGGG